MNPNDNAESGKAVLLERVVSHHIQERSAVELSLGSLRYEALRKLNPRQYRELHDRNMKGENFDGMVDELVMAKDPDQRPGEQPKTL